MHVTPSTIEKKFFFTDRDQFYDQTSLTTTNYHQIYVTSEQKSDQNVRRLLELVAQRAKTQTSIDELIEEKNQTEVEINKLCRKIGVDSEPEE